MTRQHKPGSKADRDALRHEMAAVGCGPREIAAEMRSRWGIRPREAWRMALGLTLQEAADRLNSLAADRREGMGADASLMGKWEKWPAASGRRPSLGVLSLLAELYECEVDDLLDLDDRRALPESDLRILRHTTAQSVPAERRPAPVTPQEPAEPDDLVRMAAGESALWAQWAETSNVGDLALEQIQADTQYLARSYLTGDPVKLFGQTRALRDRVFALVEGHQHPRQSTDLYVAAGYLCALLAWMSSDLGQLRDAETQGRTAWLCAELAGHDQLRAWTLSTRSKIALWDGRLRDAVNHARRGASYAPSGSAATLLACQEADAWSILGARAEAQAAITRADPSGDALLADDLGGLFSCDATRRANYAGAVHLRTGSPDRALAEVGAALAGPGRPAYGTLAQMHIAEASAHLDLGAPDGAAEALHDVLALPADRRMLPVVVRIREFAAHLGRSSSGSGRPAQELQGAIAGFVSAGAARTALSPGGAVA